MAVLPSFGENQSSSEGDVIWKAILILLETFASFIVVLGISFIFCRYVIGHFLALLATFSNELQLLGTLAIMYVMLLITQWLGISMELGCFLGGFIEMVSTLRCKFTIFKT